MWLRVLHAIGLTNLSDDEVRQYERQRKITKLSKALTDEFIQRELTDEEPTDEEPTDEELTDEELTDEELVRDEGQKDVFTILRQFRGKGKRQKSMEDRRRQMVLETEAFLNKQFGEKGARLRWLTRKSKITEGAKEED